MVRKGKLAVFEGSSISKTEEVTPIKIGVYACDINPNLHKFFEVRKGKLAVFEGSNISETGKVTPTKIGVYACDINPYLHEFLEPIPID